MSHGPEMTRLGCVWMQNNLRSARLESADCTDYGLFMTFFAKNIKKVESIKNIKSVKNNKGLILFFCWNAQFYGLCSVSQEEKKNILSGKKKRPPFHETLRSHLGGAALASICQHERDRVYLFNFIKPVGAEYDKKYTLVLESSERYSNALLLDGSGVILDLINRVYPEVNRARTLIQGAQYAPPPDIKGRKGLGLTYQKFLSENKFDLDDVLGRLYDGDACLNYFTAYTRIGGYIAPVEHKECEKNAPVGGVTPLEGMRQAVFAPLLERFLEQKKRTIKDALDAKIKNFSAQMAKIELDGKSEKASQLKLWGTLLLANAHVKLPKDAASVSLQNWDGAGSTVEVPLDGQFSALAQAEDYFNRYKKIIAKAKSGEKRLPFIKEELETLKEQQAMLDVAGDFSSLDALSEDLGLGDAKKTLLNKNNKNKKKATGFKHIQLPSCSLYVGESAFGNRRLTFNTALPEDIWFHAFGVGGAHVLLRLHGTLDENSEEHEKMIAAAAASAAWYSKSKNEAKVRVDYTKRRHVKALPEKGIAGVRYENFKSVTVKPKPLDEAVSEL